MSSGSHAERSKKRKREPDLINNPSTHHSGGSLLLRPTSTDSQSPTKVVEVIPKLLLPRSNLPFLRTSAHQPYQNRIFNADIPLLEPTVTTADDDPSLKVLIAASKDGGTVFALERVRPKIYSASILEGWLSLEEKKSKETKRTKLATSEKEERFREKTPWWDRASVTLPTTQPKETTSTSRTPEPDTGLPEIRKDPPPPEPTQESIQPPRTPKEGRSAVQESAAPASWEEITISLRKKYLEALYVSKTSLAYFAKGPLSRARNATISAIGALEGNDFGALLAEITLTVSMSDKKYSSAIPDLINEISLGAATADLRAQNVAEMQALMTRARKRKKLNRQGMLPAEEEYLCQWWLEKENSAEAVAPNLTHKERVKACLAKQRVRETQLQVIIVLETLATRASSSDGSFAEEEKAKGTKLQEEGSSQKRKKPFDLHALVDMLVDRLCIWQTTQQEDDLGDPLSNKLTAKTGGGSLQAMKTNALQDFCTEVLVPFYAARLPRVFASLCQKMGTVGVTSPARPALKKLSSSLQAQAKGQVKPGSALPRRGLKRVSTDGPLVRRAPSLARSSTDTVVTIKHEPKDFLLHDLPLHKPATTLLQDRRYSQREVDIAAISKATKAKLERKAFLEQELANAIDVLKKPNSRAAVRELVDFAEERQAGPNSKSTSKRKREPVRNGGVHVKATPRANRWQAQAQAQVQTQGQEQRQSKYRLKRGASDGSAMSGTQEDGVDADEAPPSSDPRVPSTSKRLPADKLFPVARSTVTGPFMTDEAIFTVEATPLTRRMFGRSSGTELTDQSEAREGEIQATPSRGTAGANLLLDDRFFAGHVTDEREEDGDELCATSPAPSRYMKPRVMSLLSATPSKQRGASPVTDPPMFSPMIVEATPSKASSKLPSFSIQRLPAERFAPTHPQMRLPASVHVGPSLADARGGCTNTIGGGGGGSSKSGQQEGEDDDGDDLYKALGWDNDDDDLI